MKTRKIATSLLIAFLGATGMVSTSVANANVMHDEISSLNLVGDNKKAWERLSEDEQRKVLDTLNHPDFRVGMSQEEAFKISPDIVVESTYEVKENSAQAYSSLARTAMRSGEAYEVVSEYEEKTSQLGIELGWNKIEYRYVTGNNQVLETRSCVGTYNQIVPLRTVNVSTNHWLSNGEGTCIADWSVSRGAGLVGTENWEQGMTVNGPGIKEKWFFKK